MEISAYFTGAGGTGRASARKLSTAHFHLPSACFFQTSKNLPSSVVAFPAASLHEQLIDASGVAHTSGPGHFGPTYPLRDRSVRSQHGRPNFPNRLPRVGTGAPGITTRHRCQTRRFPGRLRPLGIQVPQRLLLGLMGIGRGLKALVK